MEQRTVRSNGVERGLTGQENRQNIMAEQRQKPEMIQVRREAILNTRSMEQV